MVLAIACCSAAQARDFNVGLNGVLAGGSVVDVFDTDVYSLDAQYYFQAVSDSDGPYREAAFINPASTIAVGYANNESEQFLSETDSENWQLQAQPFARLVCKRRTGARRICYATEADEPPYTPGDWWRVLAFRATNNYVANRYRQ